MVSVTRALRFSLSKNAKRDLALTYAYTFRSVGKEQAVKYVQGLRSATMSIREHPFIGTSAEEFSKNLRRLVFKSHVIYYTVTGTDVTIQRVLDARLDPGQHLA